MSIATDEAFHYTSQKRDCKDWSGNIPFRFPVSTWSTIKKAYVAGRTAEPTEAEIEAAAEALMSSEFNVDATLFSPSEVHEIWENRPFADRETLRRKIRLVLKAARKAVTG